MAFTGVCFADLLLWFVVGRTFVKNLRLERDCLEHYCERSLKVCNWSSIQVIVVVLLFFLTGGAGIVNVQSCGMHWYLTSWLTSISTLTQSHVPSAIFLKVFRNFKEGQHFDLFK